MYNCQALTQLQTPMNQKIATLFLSTPGKVFDNFDTTIKELKVEWKEFDMVEVLLVVSCSDCPNKAIGLSETIKHILSHSQNI